MGLLDTVQKKPGLLANASSAPPPDYTGTLGDLSSLHTTLFPTKTSTQAIPDKTTPDTVGFLKEAVGIPLRAGIQAGLTLAPESVRKNIGTITPEADFGKFAASFIGKDPINSAQTDIPTVQKNLEDKGYGKLMSTLIAHVGVNGNIAIGLLPFVGSLEKGGVESLSKVIAGMKDDKAIEQLLVRQGVPDDLSRQYSILFRDMTNPNDIKRGLTALEKVSKTTKLAIENGSTYDVGSKKTVQAFKSSSDQVPVGDFELGSFGLKSAENKAAQADRFPVTELPDTQKNIVAAYRASDNPKSYRFDNIAWVAKMPDDTERVIYTRLNPSGKEEILNWHNVSDPKFIETLKTFGTPDQSRTGILSLERSTPIPLADGGTKNVAENGLKINDTTATPTRETTVPAVQDAAAVRPSESTPLENTPQAGGVGTSDQPPYPSLESVNQVPDVLSKPFKQAVELGVAGTKEPAIFKRLTKKLSEAFTSIVEHVQDSDVRVRKLLEKPEMSITDTSNAYQKATLYPGRVASKIEESRSQFEHIANDIVETSDTAGRDTALIRQDVNEYLQAVHAPERNAAFGDGAAGMTNAAAEAALKRIEALPEFPAIKRMAESARKLNEEGLALLRDAGVISKELFTSLTEKYKNHVPLNRIFEQTDDVGAALSVRGFDVRSSGIKRAKGSEREVADILSNIQHNYEQAVLRSEKNTVDQATLAFVRENRDALEGLMEVRKPRAIGKSFDNKVLMERTTDPSYLQMFENGKPVWIHITDPALALSFRGLGREKLPTLLYGVGTFTRFYAGLATRFNPEFAFPNKIRDLQETMIYMAAQKDVGFKGSVQLLAKDPRSLKDVWDGIRGVDSAGARQYAEMKAMGGTTGGFGLSTRKQTELNFDQMIETAKSTPKQTAQDVLKYIDNWNTVFEDSTRLSVYRQALSQGLSKERAAFLAKEASINFNRMGRGGPVINAIWMFSNASIQGSAKMIRSLKNPKVLATVVAAVGSSVAAVNEWNDKIDPQWRDKVSKWDRLNGLPIVLPNGKGQGVSYIVIPVSWGVKPIKVMADYAYDAASGRETDLGKMASDLFASIANAYNPLGGTDVVSALTPTILDIPTEIARNQSWSGSKIRPDFDKNAPKDVQYFSNLGETATGKAFIEGTKALEAYTGIAISPADANYAFQQLIGGAGKAGFKAGNTILGVASGKPPPADEYPFVSRFYRTRTQEEIGQGAGGETDNLKAILENQSRDRFYLKQAAEDKYKEFSALPKDEAAKQWQELYKTSPDIALKVADIAKQDKKGLTYTERLMLDLGVKDGQRASYLVNKFNELKSNEDKSALWKDYVAKGIITSQVADQIEYLFKQATTPNKQSNAGGTASKVLGALTGAPKAEAAAAPEAEQPKYFIRDNTVTPSDLEEAKAVLFGEISNRSSDKQLLEAQTILNTAFNRMDAYRKKGINKTLTEVLQMDNQYQAYKGREYNRLKRGDLRHTDQQKLDAIDAMLSAVKDGTFQNNIGDYTSYRHDTGGRILAVKTPLFK